MRVAILGRTHWLLDSAKALQAAGFDIALVATATAAPEYKAREGDFAHFAQDCGVPFLLPPDINDEAFRQAVANSGAQVAVSINWPSLIGSATCAAFPRGILNGHAGDLPRYRGNACPNWAILNGESRIGVCVHAMDPNEVDAGPIYARGFIAVDETTYISDAYAAIETLLPRLFATAVQHALDPDFKAEDQARSSVTPLRCHPRRPDDGRIDWRNGAVNIARLVRASSRPFAGAFSFLEGVDRVTVWRARVQMLDHDISAVPGQIIGRSADRAVLVACGSGVLAIEEADCDSGRKLPGANRYRLTDGRA